MLSKEETYYFFVSQIRQDQNWCFSGPDVDGTLGFGLCQQHFDEYWNPQQAWRLDEEGRLLNRRYGYADYGVCVVANDGVTIGDGRLRYRACDEADNGDLNKFAYDATTQTLRLSALEQYCVTNHGTSPDVGDFMLVMECEEDGRFRFDMVEGRRHWQILGGQECPERSCLMAEYPVSPNTGDKVLINECTSGGLDAWRYEDAGSSAVLVHNRQHDSLCLQAGVDEDPRDGTELVLYPCDVLNEQQRFVQVYDNENYDYQYRMILAEQPDLCVTFRGDNCRNGDEVVLKDCSSNGVSNWFDDEG